MDTASYLQTKYTINNKVLKYLSAIDPSARGHCLTHSYLKELYGYFAPFIKVDGSDYGLEIQRYMSDSSFPLFNVDDRLDEWWNNVFKTSQYPVPSQDPWWKGHLA